jgi:predicted hydrocarbon binding protein
MNKTNMNKTEIPIMSDEQRENITKSVMAEGWLITLKSLENLVGAKTALEEQRILLRNAGHAFASNMRSLFKIEGDDIHAIGIVSALGDLFFEIDSKEIDHTDQRIVKVCTCCIWQNCPAVWCTMEHTWTEYYVEAMNPDFEVRLTQMVTKGDPICSWVIEKKK